jgi:hypothetical protein
MRLVLGPNVAPSQAMNTESGAKGTRTPDLLVAKVSSVGDEVDDPRE